MAVKQAVTTTLSCRFHIEKTNCFIELFFIYCYECIVDGIDGKQARRTRTSSPLGELFDHGLDSWHCSLYLFNIYTLYGQHEMPGIL